MAFDNRFYPNRKDNRRVYPKWERAKNVDRSCRNHGTCTYCLRNRTINLQRILAKAKDMLDE
jgi:hypothetical protein